MESTPAPWGDAGASSTERDQRRTGWPCEGPASPGLLQHPRAGQAAEGKGLGVAHRVLSSPGSLSCPSCDRPEGLRFGGHAAGQVFGQMASGQAGEA